MNVKVELKPLGNKVKATIFGQPFCTRQNTNLHKSFMWELNDMVLETVFGSMKSARKFAGGTKSIVKVVDGVKVFGFDSCDIVK